MEPKLLHGTPGGLSTLLKAALPVVPGLNQLPGVRKSSAKTFTSLSYARTGVEASRADVDAYAAVCGFPRKDTVPLPYPHLLAFPLHMAIMSDPAFPYPAIGMVHLENTITTRRAIGVGEVLVQVGGTVVVAIGQAVRSGQAGKFFLLPSVG